MEQHSISCIHSHWMIPQGLAAVLYRKFSRRRVKLLMTVHGGDVFALRNFLGTFLKKFVLRNTQQVTAVSQAIGEELKKYGYKKEVFVCPMGIDTTLFHPNKKDAKILSQYAITNGFILFVGRLVEKKGLPYLLEAMPEILKEFPSIKLLIIGFGELEKQYVTIVERLKIQESVIFAGEVPHEKLPSFFATADIFVGPSIVASDGDTEGFGLVFAEALSSGTPVVASNLPAIHDIIEDGETGFLVGEKNTKEISEKVVFLLQNREGAEKFKKKGRQHVCEHFAWDTVTSRYAALMKD